MINYDSLATTAFNLIENAGKQVEIKRISNSTVDKVTQSFTEGQTRSFITRCAVLPASKGTVAGFDNKSREMTATHQRFLIVSAKAEIGTPFEPDGEDQIVLDNLEWTVAGCTPVSPAGTPLIYRVGCFR